MAFLQRAADPRLSRLAPVILYRTLPLPEELREGAVVFGLALRAAMAQRALARARRLRGTPLEAAARCSMRYLGAASGVVFAVDAGPRCEARSTPDRKIHVALPDLLAELERCSRRPAASSIPRSRSC